MIEKEMNDKDRFTMTELAALRNDSAAGWHDRFLRSRRTAPGVPDGPWLWGFARRRRWMLQAASKWPAAPFPVLQHELENLAMVM